nr:MAG TPA: hypothetical protein [Caudoviricetes sp.]
MANDENLKKGIKTRFNGETAARNGQKGGIAKAQKQAEKKTIQSILTDFLNAPCSDMEQFNALAKKMGIETNRSKKELFTMICVMNSIKKGNLDDIEKLIRLLGEDIEQEKKTSNILQGIFDLLGDSNE